MSHLQIALLKIEFRQFAGSSAFAIFNITVY